MDVFASVAVAGALFVAGLAASRRLDPALAARVSLPAPGALGVRTEVRGMRLPRSRPVRPDARLERRLALSGRDLDGPMHRRNRRRWAVGGAGAGMVLGGASASGLPLALILSAAAYRIPDVRLARVVRRRQSRIARSVGDLCQILAACVGAGLGPGVSLELASRGLRGPLAEELARAVGLLGVGARWRDVLDELAGRTDAAGMGRLRAALLQTERLGTSLEGALRDLAREERGARRAAAEARARAAPVKLLFPLALLILPAFLLLTVVPVVMATLRSLG